MYRFYNICNFYNNNSFKLSKHFNFSNILQIKLEEYDIFSSKKLENKNYLMKINYGKIILNFTKGEYKNEIFAEKDKLFEIRGNRDIVLTDKEHYIHINKNVEFLLQSYEKSNFNIYF